MVRFCERHFQLYSGALPVLRGRYPEKDSDVVAGKSSSGPLPEPGHRLPEPLLDGVLRVIPKRLPRPGDIGERVPDVARARRLVDGVAPRAGEVREHRRKLVEADPAAAGDVEDALGIALHRPDIRLDHIGDEGEVAGLPPVAIDD